MKKVLLHCQLAWLLAVPMFYAQSAAAQEQSDSDKGCSNATLRGSFGYTSTGTLLPSYVPPPFAGPFAEIGRQTFDGKGKTDAIVTFSANGNIAQDLVFEGTYKVRPDCTGLMTLSNPSIGAIHAEFVIDDDGAEIRAISTDSGAVESRVYRKQFRECHKEE